MTEVSNFNHLRDEASPYLRQHSKSPVNWFPYGPEALQKAKDENKPIFLSIGHSSSHWCHLMAAECFTDMEIANFLNNNFINIKVDKEELPDLDNYYQLASQVMNGRGGWPLNVFLTPSMRPFFVGTYFSTIATKDNPSFLELIKHLKDDFKNENDKIEATANQIVQTINAPPKVEHKVQFEGHYPSAPSILNALKDYQDDQHGGHGVEPKFPHYAFLEWAIEHMLEGMIPEELGKHIILSVDRILMGGISDHARGGIHRYAIDQKWTIPQFEKMLYDQAGLLKVLAKVSLIYPSPLVFDTMIHTIDYLQNEMLSNQGHFFSSQDSDSEGVEGLYYTFTKDEFIDAIIQFDETLDEKIDSLLEWFNISDKGNFDHQLNVIHLNPKYQSDFFTPEGWSIIRKVRQAIMEARKLRFPPSTDNKGVASWNFMILSSLLEVTQYCKIESIKNAAYNLYQDCHQRIIDTFIRTNEEGKIRIRTSTTRDHHIPLFEDYVIYAEFCFKAYELFGNKAHLQNAEKSMLFIFNEFYKNDIFYTRAISHSDTEEYENIHTTIFDQSYKSSFATYIAHLRKWSMHFSELQEQLIAVEHSIENLTHLSLQNPLHFGETLRALTYPDMAYKKIEVPLSWQTQGKFNRFHINFSGRFIIFYHEMENEKWQISNRNECELQGEGLEEFAKIFTVSAEVDKQSENS